MEWVDFFPFKWEVKESKGEDLIEATLLLEPEVRPDDVVIWLGASELTLGKLERDPNEVARAKGM
jgi:hypothetical protein